MALTDSLISFWELEETSGQRNDSTATANHLADINTVTSGTGIVGTAASFAVAFSEELSCTSNASLVTGDIDFTVAGWIKLATKTNESPIISKFGPGGEREYLLRYDQGGDRFQLYVSSNGSGDGTVDANVLGSPSTGTWYFVVAWHDSVNNLIGIAVNGGTANTAAFTVGVGTSSTVLRIGGREPNTADGLIDQVGFWKRVLDSSDRAALYNGGAGLSYAALVAGGGAEGLSWIPQTRVLRGPTFVAVPTGPIPPTFT